MAMGDRETGSDKLNLISSALDKLEKRNKYGQQIMTNNLDFITEQLNNTVQALEAPDTDLLETMKNLTQKLKQEKALTKINENNKSTYPYVSKVRKKIKKLKQYPNKTINFFNLPIDRAILKNAISDYIVHFSTGSETLSSNTNKSDVFERLGLKPYSNINVHMDKIKKIKKLEDYIETRNLKDFMKWISDNESKIMEKDKNLIQLTYQLYILQITYEQDDMKKVLFLCQKYLKNKEYICEEETRKFIVSLAMSKKKEDKNELEISTAHCSDNEETNKPLQEIREMYKKQLSVEDKWKAISNIFDNKIYNIYDIPKNNPLFELFEAGIHHFSDFIDSSQLAGDNLDNPTIEIEKQIDNRFINHNLVVCPVNKEICSEDDPPIKLICGHVLSESSIKRHTNTLNFDNYTTFRCPVCLKDQNTKKIRYIKIKDN